MKVEVALSEVRNKTNDRDEIGLGDEEVLSYLNEAIQYVSAYLIAANSPLMVKVLEIRGKEADLPQGFVRFVGLQPIKVTGTEIELLDEPPVKLRYFANPSYVMFNDDMPFDNVALNQVAIKLASIYVNAQQRLDVQQDKALLDEINGAIAGAIGAAK